MLAAAKSAEEIAAIVFIDIAVIIVVARLMGALFKRLRQPAVVGEILGGILLGPSLLGAFPGDLDGRLFPTEVRPYLNVVAQLGLIIFMFIVGMELDIKLIRGKERIAAVISGASIMVPFGLGFLLAAALYGSHKVIAGEEIDFLPFALFIGASMSITAFPVLARILTERGMHRTDTGVLTLACAAVDDILAWSLLAVVVAVKESSGISELPRILGLSIAFVVFMFAVVRPLLARVADWYHAAGRLTPNILSVILVGLLVSSYVTSKIGIHSIFGAFLFGAIMPRLGTHRLFEEILERLENVSVLLLLPVFFIATGLDVNVRNIGLDGVGQLALILLVACAGKFIGAAAAARAQGIASRKASAIGILMNTRGLTELVILNIGLEKGVLDAELFTLLVVMAVVTTVMTEPALRLVYPDRILQRDIADAEKAALGPDAHRVLVAVKDPTASASELVDLAVDLVGGEQPSEVVITRFVPAIDRGELGSGLTVELADMTDSLAGLHRLSQRADQRGVRSVVLSQFSTDIAGDLVAQADAVDADVALLDGRGPDDAGDVARAMLHDADCDVVVLIGPRTIATSGGEGDAVVATIMDDEHDAAVLDIAVRVARARGAPLALDLAAGTRRAARRTSALAERVERVGVRLLADPPAAVALHVRSFAEGVTEGTDDAAMLVVRAKPALAPESADQRLDRLVAAVVQNSGPRPRSSEGSTE